MPLNELYVPTPRTGKWFIDAHATAGAKGYDASQPRDEQGRWSNSGGTGIPQYHGTGPRMAEMILEQGLKRGEEKLGRPPSVYFTTDQEVAKDYGWYSHNGKQFAIVEFDLDEEGLDRVQPDEEENRAGYRIEQDIPPERIRAVHLYDSRTKELLETKPNPNYHDNRKGFAPNQAFYAPVEIVGEGDKGYDPNQPRDEQGRWSSGSGGEPKVPDNWLDPKPAEVETPKDTAALANWETHDRVMRPEHLERWNNHVGPMLEEAKHLDKLVKDLKAKASKTDQKYNQHLKLVNEISSLESERWNTEDEAKQQELDAKIVELTEQQSKAWDSWRKTSDTENNRMIKAVRQHIQKHLKENLDIGAPVEMRVLESGKYEPVVSKAQELLRGCITERISSKHTTAHVIHTDPNDENGGVRAYHNQVRNPQTFEFITSSLNLPDNTDYPTVIHEFGHAVEVDSRVKTAAHAFLAHRVGSEKPVPLHIEQPGRSYKEGELGRKDDFEKAFGSNGSYVGKFYSSGSTEIMSMGMEKLFSNPVEFAKKDPEYFKFVVGVLDGSLI